VSTLVNQSADSPHRPSPRLQLLQGEGFKKIPWLVHGFSTRPGGLSDCYGSPSLNLGFTQEDSREHVEENRSRFLVEMGATSEQAPWPLLTNRQIHSDIIHVAETSTLRQLAGDGLITNIPGVVIAVLTADCLPVLLADRKRKVVGAFHAGWRGTVKRIAEKGLGAMRHEYGSQPEDIHAVIGPGIQSCCYPVGEEVKSEFESQFPYAQELFHEVQASDPVREKYPLLFLNARAPGHGDLCVKLHLDLSEANRRQLLTAGVPEQQIAVLGECTACDTQKFFSHRAENGRTGRMLAGIGIKP
jgi:polyphenol oxidase